ncbi:MAG: hypothetical protein H6755_01285 [Candidatus Omnitrophica bacterium]|nr:hypothetical protein [Candidatus Omnitrophota bacterium]MCB9747024.1 hypothetical protein [Candidatus Omnitrophota bacterium]
MNKTLQQLYQYVKQENFSGWDPFDGLNSVYFKESFFYKSEFLRLCWIQLFKQSPLNLRSALKVPKSLNPKGAALFLSGLVNLHEATAEQHYLTDAQELFQQLIRLQLNTKTGIGWGYNFDWQAKAFFVPEGTANVVTTVFVGQALLDYWKWADQKQREEIKNIILGVVNFIYNEMIIWQTESQLCFAYIPQKKTEVHNANLMTAAFLARVLTFSDIKKSIPLDLKALIIKAVEFSTEDIDDDGYWPYGTMDHHRWMDNFHTAFNLQALLQIKDSLKLTDYDNTIEQVYHYYIWELFLEDSRPKYYHNKLFPVDIHTIAEAIILLTQVLSKKYNNRDGENIFTQQNISQSKELLKNLQQYVEDEFFNEQGYFYYQQGKYLKNKIPYMRWSQAWMFKALAVREKRQA